MHRQKINHIDFNLAVSIFQQGDSYIAYTPALDISTYGRSKAEAMKNFEELVDVFFSEFDDTRELGQTLESLGWVKQNNAWQPPKIETTETSFSIPATYMAV